MNLEVEHALLRGRYMKAAARIEHQGIPIDVDALATLKENWTAIQDELIRRIDLDYCARVTALNEAASDGDDVTQIPTV